MKNFKKFLIKAKKNTYASNGEGSEKQLSDGAKELSYLSNNFYYRDRYYGSDYFVGEEVVFINKKIFWSMNYAGGCLKNNTILKKEIYSFLKACLKKVNTDNPFRGPQEYKKGDFLYKNKFSGNIDDFYGNENIYYKNKKVYKLRYHGGIIK